MEKIVGKPSKKKIFDLAGKDVGSSDCALKGNDLYVLYYFSAHDKDSKIGKASSCCIKKIDLDSFGGDESGVPNIYSIENIAPGSGYVALLNRDDYLVAIGDPIVVIDPSKSEVVFDESKIEKYSHWSQPRKGGAFFFEENYYRMVDGQNLSKGLDVYGVKERKVIDHHDIDIDWPVIHRSGLIIGQRQSGFLAIYSIKEKRIVFELPPPVSGFLKFNLMRSPDFEDRLAIIHGDNVLTVNLKTMDVTHKINYLQARLVQDFMRNFKTSEKYSFATKISGFGDFLTVSGGTANGYVFLLNLLKSDPMSWVYGNWHSVIAHYAGGDLVFGIDSKRPVAWDVYNGEKVWEASAPTSANIVQVGDRWVVYHQAAGYIQCFDWKKPYISPHRPQ